jgi:hypothetical protein
MIIDLDALLTDSEREIKREIETVYLTSGGNKEKIHDKLRDWMVYNVHGIKVSDYMVEEARIGPHECLLVSLKYHDHRVFEFYLNRTQMRDDRLNMIIGD